MTQSVKTTTAAAAAATTTTTTTTTTTAAAAAAAADIMNPLLCNVLFCIFHHGNALSPLLP